MLIHPKFFRAGLGALLSSICLSLCPPAWSADKPELTMLFPAGGQAGTTVEVVATGKFPVWPIQIWTDSPKIEWSCQSEPGKLQLKIEADAEPGLHYMRLFEPNGATASRPFLVGNAPQLNETEPNDSPGQATELPTLPQNVYGVLNKNADVDLFAVVLKANETLAATIDSHKWLSSPADVSLQILDSRGFVLAENLDHVGLDPYLEYTPPSATKVLVRVFGFPTTPDSNIGFSGGSTWIYRLRLSTEPTPLGSALDYNDQSKVEALTVQEVAPPSPTVGEALTIAVPGQVVGTITAARQMNYVRFAARANANYRFAILAREFGSPLDATLAVLDAQGKSLTQIDDVRQNRDPVLNWKAPADGDYLVSVTDFHHQGGTGFRYLLSLEERPADFTLNVANDLIAAVVGKETDVEVALTREHDYAELVHVSVEGLPSTAECAVVESKHGSDSAGKVTLKIKGTEAFQGPIRVVAKSAGDVPLQRTAQTPENKPLWLSITAE